MQEIGFDPEANEGIGGAFIRQVDNRSIMFDPLATELQTSRAVFKFSHRTRDWFTQHYPEIAPELTEDGYLLDIAEDDLLTPRYNKSIMLIEAWVREYDADERKYRVHMLMLAGGKLLEDSRRVRPEGYFAHGEYPFIITTLFPRKGSCLGYGFVDMYSTMQQYSDKLDQIVMKNALLASHNKLLITGASGFDSDDLRTGRRISTSATTSTALPGSARRPCPHTFSPMWTKYAIPSRRNRAQTNLLGA